MRRVITLLLPLLFSLCLFGQTSVLSFGSNSWRFLDNGLDQGTNWRALNFSDDSWKPGQTKIGYGINDAATIASYGKDSKNKYVTTYFRNKVTIANLNTYDAYNGKLKRDDGAVVYLNGTEVYRNNMPSGTITFNTTASGSGDGGSSIQTFSINKSSLVAGDNIIAVEVHIQKTNASEKDMAFDFAIDGVQIPPTVLSINRQSAVQTTNANTVVYRAVFSEPVSNVDISDFTPTVTAGSLSASVSNVSSVGTDGTTYDVTVNNITGSGTLKLDLKNSGTGIVDNNSNPIATGFATGQTYIIDQTAPSVVSINRQLPTTGSTNASSVTFRAVFSEKVTGVNASDFVLNMTGTLAANIGTLTAVGVDGTTYDITVNSITGDGILRMDLLYTGSGIADNLGNALATDFTTGQTYVLDHTAPSVLSINRQSPLGETTTNSSVIFRVTFSESVSGVDVNDFATATVSGSLTATVSSVTPVGTNGINYDVTVGSISGTGTFKLNLKSSGTGIVDNSSNNISGGFTTGQTYKVESTTTITEGFATVTTIDPLSVSAHTGEKPQSKTWYYAGKWWAVLPTLGGTKIFRLEGTAWTEVLNISSGSTNSKADVKVVGNLVHILLFRGASNNSFLISIEYDQTTNNYKLWSLRPTRATIVFEPGAETATLDIDGTGRMWIASDAVSDINVRYSDASTNYATWSAPITIATNVTDDDICQVVSIPTLNKIGLMWSDQNSKHFGFKTHNDGADPTVWSSDEAPGAANALNLGLGMADDHISIDAASNGTLYCAVKTGYETNGVAKIALLIRRPNDTWDPLYPVTTNLIGTRPIIILNEVKGKIKIIYTSLENGGNILYKESLTSNISFGQEFTLLTGNYNYSTSTHQIYNPDVVILATEQSVITDLKAVGVYCSDDPSTVNPIITQRPAVKDQFVDNGNNTLTIFPTQVKRGMQVNLRGNTSSSSLFIVDSYGRVVKTIQSSSANSFETKGFAAGIYFIISNEKNKFKTQKFLVTD